MTAPRRPYRVEQQLPGEGEPWTVYGTYATLQAANTAAALLDHELHGMTWRVVDTSSTDPSQEKT